MKLPIFETGITAKRHLNRTGAALERRSLYGFTYFIDAMGNAPLKGTNPLLILLWFAGNLLTDRANGVIGRNSQ